MRALLACVLVFGLSACTVLREAADELEQSESRVEEAQAQLESSSAPPRSSFSVEAQSLWLGASAVRSPQGDPLPPIFRDTFALTVASGPPGEPSKRRLLSQVSRMLGLRVEVDPVTLSLARQASEGADARLSAPPEPPPGGAAPPGGPVPLPPPVALPPEPPDLSDLDIASGDYLDGSLSEDFVFTGSGVSLVTRLASALGFPSWVYEAETIWLVRHELRELPLHVLSRGSPDRLEEALDSLRRSCGACTVDSMPTLGVVHVTALPSMMRRVEDWLGDLNRRLTEQFVVDLDVYAVTRESNRSLSVDLDLAFGSDDSRRAISIGVPTLASPGGAPGSPDASAVPSSSLRILPRGFFRNSSLTVPTALSSVGRVSKVYSTSFVTLNGEVQRVVQREARTVVINVSSTTGESGNVESSENVETLSDGFTIEVTTLSLGHDRVMLSYSFLLDEIIYPTASTSELSTVRSRVLTRDLSNSVALPLGSTLVFNAFDRVSATARDQGSLHPQFWLPDGSASSGRDATSFVVTLRASALRPSDPSLSTGA